jgi:hypothetical protein
VRGRETHWFLRFCPRDASPSSDSLPRAPQQGARTETQRHCTDGCERQSSTLRASIAKSTNKKTHCFHRSTPNTTTTSISADKPPAFLEEAAGPRYVIEVDVDAPPGSLDDPAHLEPGARTLTLPGPGGVAYTCVIPPPPLDEENEGRDDALSASSSTPSPAALVASLDGTCLYRMEDWWTYEFCAGRHARQFHREPDGPGAGGSPGAVVSEFYLGRWNETAPIDPVPRSDPGGLPEEEVAFVSQEYGGGQPCDLTGAPRGVEVRFVCADGGSGGGGGGGAAGGKNSALDGVPAPTGPRDALLAVREPATCRYTFVVAVADLCAHPAFRRAEPPTLAVRCAVRGEGESVGDA